MAARGGIPTVQPSEPGFIDEGWRKADSIVREVHGQKVSDCKENMDGILIFAGLYSAVLTAFLVELYKTLQPNMIMESVSALQRVACQLSVSDDELISSGTSLALNTSGPTSTSKPSRTAELVNILWFASLVLSLACASFCITVQQWLREFLAMGDEDAQCRLRIRYFRERGLSRWMVYDVAAILPLLIQISLALFFVGLCYFTAAANETVGHVTLPLVSAWAFLFVTSILLPMLVPQCPYRVPIVKSVLSIRFWRKLLPARKRSADECPSRLSVVPRTEDIAKDTAELDLEILLYVDILRLDDEFLTGAMWSALQPATRLSTDLISFIYSSIGHRATRSTHWRPSSQPGALLPVLPSNLLPPATYNAIIKMVAVVVRIELNRQNTNGNEQGRLRLHGHELEELFDNCFFVLFTHFEYRASIEVDEAIRLCLSNTGCRDHLFTFLRDTVRWHEATQESYFGTFLARMRHGIVMTEKLEDLNRLLDSICPEGPGGRNRNTDEDYTLAAPILARYQSFEFHTSIARIKLRDQNNLTWESSLMKRIVDLSASRLVELEVSHGVHNTEELMRYLLLESTDSQGAASILQTAWSDDSVGIVSRRRIERFIKQIFLDNVGSLGLTQLLVHVIQVIDPEWQTESEHRACSYRSRPPKRRILYVLQMCSFYLNLLYLDVALFESQRNRPLWKKFFCVLARHLRNVHAEANTNDEYGIPTTQGCFDALVNVTSYMNAVEIQQDKIFPSELISELERIHGSPFNLPRINMIQPQPTVTWKKTEASAESIHILTVALALFQAIRLMQSPPKMRVVNGEAHARLSSTTIQPTTVSPGQNGGEEGDHPTPDPALDVD